MVDDNSLALDAFQEVGVGKHFLGCAHTMDNYQTAFWDSAVADNEPFEKWDVAGRTDAATRANSRWKQTLAEYQAPAMDVATDEALIEFVGQTKAKLADAWY